MYYIYILKCNDNTLYTGITTDVERRLCEHLSGEAPGAKYTRSHPPVSVEAIWSTRGRKEASKLEYAVKHLSRQKKDELIWSPSLISDFFENLTSDFEFKFEGEYTKACNQNLSSTGSRK